MKGLKKGLKSAVVLFVISLFLTACASNVNIEFDPSEEVKIAYRFADREEGVSLLLGNTEYYNGLNQNSMDYRAQKEGATLEEVKEYAANQVLDFSEDEKKAIDNSISTIESILKENGYVLPQFDEVVFVRTTQHEEGGADAYTHKFEIYVGDSFMEPLLSDDEAMQRAGNAVMCHEIFHSLTRNNPQFRKDMYSIINFTVQDKEFELTPELAELLLFNPDVDHRDSYATFTINGEKKDCFLVLTTTQPFKKDGDNFVGFAPYAMPVLVPIDDMSTYYPLWPPLVEKEIFDAFVEVVGINTQYFADPEEIMADNFSYAIMYGKNGIEGQPYGTPEIINKIINYLKK